MGKISFSVSARTAKLIGQENFATAEGAVIELVKNSYDADAKNCVIIFENDSKFASEPTLYIIDNGIGMTDEVIKKQWMKIGTDDKLQNFRSDGGRVKTGAKGIGRFALDRLGLSSEMQTIAQQTEKGALWSVNWSDFDKRGISISDVEADLSEINNPDIKKTLLQKFESVKPIIDCLSSIDFQSGTVLKINPLKDRWDEHAIKSLFDNLEVLIPPQEQPEFSVHLFSKSAPYEFGLVNSAYYDDFDYKVFAKYFGDKERTLEITITRNELDIEKLETSYNEVFENNLLKNSPFDLNTIKEKTFTLTRTKADFPIFTKANQDLLDKLGEFEFTFYFLKNLIDSHDKNKYPYKDISPANRRAWLNKFGGVKVFRDDFRVRPYGEDGQDWLKLGERQAKSPGGPGQKMGGYRIGPNQIAGTVKISRIANASFQDKSGREGIQENEVFELFRNVLIDIIGVFERDRNLIMFSLSELSKKKYKAEEDRKKAIEEAERILQEQEVAKKKQADDSKISSKPDVAIPPSTTNNTNTEVLFATATMGYEQELQEKNEEIKLLRGLASVGLIISSFAHELKGLRSRLVPRTDFLIKELKKLINEEALSKTQKEDNPFYMLELIKNEDLKLKHWLDYSLSTLKRDKRTRTNINFGDYFQDFEANWRMALQQRNVKMNLMGDKDPKNVIQAFEVDLDAVFNNLLSNTLSAFKEKKGSYSREVTIAWKLIGEFIEIRFSDNGAGLAEEYITEPNKIFEFNESSKTDRTGNKIGTGMGLYIVKLVIDDYKGADINILPSTEGFSLGIKFATRKNKDV
ncbi:MULTISPECIES: sensor histidine kinase [unclassified Sphingobacterium]|uniref:ATP-binding protein n=1 Tax=unclassified Sphingobacterium TaxID=2609468 RepID=UPI0020C40A60|nr:MULTISPECIES: sensor histidine kinase [unclassified Sphingobacterium]